MNTLPTLPLTKIGFFNPGRLSDQEIEQLFVARIPLLELLFGKIVKETPGSIPQHYLLVGQRGMGKSSLLARLAAELRKPGHRDKFIPLSFPEEQYNVDQLAKFWLNCMDALADAIDKEGNRSHLPELDATIQRLARDRNAGASDVYDSFQEWATRIGRRPVLLVDNLNLIFSIISKEEQHQLRAILMSRNAPVLVGASTDLPEETTDYSAPFYDAFQTLYLTKLSFEESLQILLNLAQITGKEKFPDEIYRHQPRLHALYALTGGSPRTLALLFPLVQDGFNEQVQTDLDGLLDTVTPLYKARFEELPNQQQVILDAIALNWDPVTLDKLRELTRLDNPQISPQLKRLTETGWIQKIAVDHTKSNAYEVSERFFNIWYLMRRSSRRQKRELYCLTKFLEAFYGDQLQYFAKKRLSLNHHNENQIAIDLALADAVKDKKLSKQLREKSYESIAEILRKDDRILERFSLPGDFRNKKEIETANKMLEFLRKKQYPSAIEEGKQGLKLNQESAFLWNIIGFTYSRIPNLYTEAEQAYLKAISLDGKDADIWNNLGDLYAEQPAKLAEAELAYLKAISLDGKDADIWNNLGDLYAEHLSKYTKAEKAYLKAISLDGKNPHIWNNLGDLYANHLSKYTEAEKSYSKAIELNEKSAYSWNNLGDLYANYLGKYTEAEKSYSKAIELDEKSAYSWNNLGDLYANHLGKYTEAEKSYSKAIELNEKSAYSWNNLGDLYTRRLRKYVEAENSYLKAIVLDEKDASPWNGLGNLYQYRLNKYTEAEKSYLKAIALDEKDAIPWINLGDLYQYRLGKFADAEQAYQQAISLDEKYAYPWNGLGDLYQYRLGKYADAEQAYQQAISLDEISAYPWNNLGNLYKDHLGKYAEAEKSYLKAISLDEKNAIPWNGLGNLYQGHLGKFIEAERAYQKAISLDEKLTYSWNCLGNLYLDHLKQFEKAAKAYEKALELDPNDDVAKLNLIFLWRDKMGETGKARQLFNALTLNKDLADSYWLQRALFDFYGGNLAEGELNLQKAIKEVPSETLPVFTRVDWYRSFAVMVKLGHTDIITRLMTASEWDITMRPVYVAVQSLTAENPELFLNTVAAEVREPARKIAEWMRNYLD